ncbi:hypothetical protein DV735_g1030, partial [Chaetothyriales sp. CBS 134920]
MGRSSTKDPDGWYKPNEVHTNRLGRLRRSLRGSSPIIQTKEAQFEKIICRFSGGQTIDDMPVLRQFHMPSQILAAAQTILYIKKSVSAFEKLTAGVVLHILSYLKGNDQIMAALSCKRLASIVEASPVGKIANVTAWQHRPRYGLMGHDSVRKGYLYPAARSWYSEYLAVDNHCGDLIRRVGVHLGNGYQWCPACNLFRLKSGTWWREFAEYENPGILEKEHISKRLENAIEMWWSPECDEDEHGRRTITDPPEK